MSDYYVIAFSHSREDLTVSLKLVAMGNRETIESMKRIAEDPFRIGETVRVRAFFYNAGLSDAANLPPIEEYAQYLNVYFLNKAAMEMCRDNGFHLSVLKTIAEKEIPAERGTSWDWGYIPK